MTEQQRHDRIAEFLETQSYLVGLEYTIKADHVDADKIMLTFVKVTKRQLNQLAHCLRINDMHHITVTGKDIILEENKPRHKKKKPHVRN